MKQFKGKLCDKDVTLTKLSAHKALRVHAKVISLISGSISEIAKGAGKTDEEQAEALGNALATAFEATGATDEFVALVDENLTDGNVVIDGQRVQHLDDLDRWDTVDGSELMYAVFAEWCKLNLGDLLKKAGGFLTG